MIYFLSFSLILTLFFLFVSIRKNLELLEKIESIEDQVEESVDILDEYYKIIDAKSKTEVFFDEPLVKSLIQDINGCKNAVVLVSNKLYSEQNNKEDEN